MPIKYVPHGDKFKAGQLWGEGRHQLSILKNLMSFQKLQQLQRIVRFDNGTIIKCLSCFGQDVVDIFVPLPIGEKAIMPKERLEIKIYPAFEVYDGNTYASGFIGIVLCKGGGFEPPYEFIAKDSLPRDLSDEPKEPLPEERIWWDYYRGDLDDVAIPKSRMLEDLVPVGIADPVDVVLAPTTVSLDVSLTGKTYPYKECTIPAFFACLSGPRDGIWGRCGEFFYYSRSESLYQSQGISFNPDGRHTEHWSPFSYEGGMSGGGLKPVQLLGFQPNFFRKEDGSGDNHFQESFFKEVCNNPCTADLNVPVVAHSLILPSITTYDFVKRAQFHDEDSFVWLAYNYTFVEQGRSVWLDYFGSILNADEYAIIYSEYVIDKTRTDTRTTTPDEDSLLLGYCFTPVAPGDGTTIITGGDGSGPLIVVIDNESVEIKPFSELVYSNVRYHQVGEKSIGLFFAVENYPFEYTYIFTSALDGETECIQTQVFDVEDYSFYHPIPGITDNDDNPVYGNGHMRLIRETIVRPEEPLNL